MNLSQVRTYGSNDNSKLNFSKIKSTNSNNENNILTPYTINNNKSIFSHQKLNSNTFITEQKSISAVSQVTQSQQVSNNLRDQKPKLITFINYEVLKDETYQKFYDSNQIYWPQISYIIDNFIKLFKKLTLKQLQVYADRILDLSKDELRVLQNRDLLLCIYEKDLDSLGLNPTNPIELYSTLKEKFIIKIQKTFRKYLVQKKVEEMKIYFSRLIFMQHMIRSIKLKIKARKKAKELFNQRYEEWKLMMKEFKKNWDTIKNSPRIEIHFNSISLPTTNSIYLNTTFHKFSERENNELNRIINLIDENVEIIYISPHQLNQDIILFLFLKFFLNNLNIDLHHLYMN